MRLVYTATVTPSASSSSARFRMRRRSAARAALSNTVLTSKQMYSISGQPRCRASSWSVVLRTWEPTMMMPPFFCCGAIRSARHSSGWSLTLPRIFTTAAEPRNRNTLPWATARR